MIISRTPFRVSLFGGGTDYPAWFRDNGGAVLGTAIDKHCYLTIRCLPPFFEHRHRIVYSKVELVQSSDQIEHPVVRTVFEMMPPKTGLELHYDADLPARAGLGSSSAFTVGLLHAMKALDGKMASKKELSDLAIHVEQERLKEHVGCQDQIWAAHGGFNRIDFKPDGAYSITPATLTGDRRTHLQGSMLLLFTGFSRYASEIAKDQIDRIGENNRQLTTMRAMVEEAWAILSDEHDPVPALGNLLNDSWRLKRALSDGVSNPEIDALYDLGISCGAYGGKLLGAGGGGFLFFLASPEAQNKIREKLPEHIHVTVGFDSVGSSIIVYEPDGIDPV